MDCVKSSESNVPASPPPDPSPPPCQREASPPPDPSPPPCQRERSPPPDPSPPPCQQELSPPPLPSQPVASVTSLSLHSDPGPPLPSRKQAGPCQRSKQQPKTKPKPGLLSTLGTYVTEAIQETVVDIAVQAANYLFYCWSCTANDVSNRLGRAITMLTMCACMNADWSQSSLVGWNSCRMLLYHQSSLIDSNNIQQIAIDGYAKFSLDQCSKAIITKLCPNTWELKCMGVGWVIRPESLYTYYTG